jgi:hypothetical protein
MLSVKNPKKRSEATSFGRQDGGKLGGHRRQRARNIEGDESFALLVTIRKPPGDERRG